MGWRCRGYSTDVKQPGHKIDGVKQGQVESRKDIACLELLIRQLLPNSNN